MEFNTVPDLEQGEKGELAVSDPDLKQGEKGELVVSDPPTFLLCEKFYLLSCWNFSRRLKWEE